MHDNIVYFEISNVKELKFEYLDHAVSKGSKFDTNIETELSKDGLKWRMCIKADRHGTSEVAKWFKDQITNHGTQTGAAVGCDSYDDMPGGLNFAVKGNLIVTNPAGRKIKIPNVIIAQGHNARSHNNWWIGGAEFENVVNIKMLAGMFKKKAIAYERVIGGDKSAFAPEYVVFYPASGVNTFNVTHVKVAK